MPDYKSTLNLPKTDFAMKANLAQAEPQTVKRWQDERLYEAVQEARADAPLFAFHDGPPYANGSIHLGHLLNKVLKDIVVRSRLMDGMRVPYVPGWDCHGLPIEHKVVTEMNEKGKLQKVLELPDDQRRMVIRRECQAYAEKFVKLQAGQMQRLLTLADYGNPYLTMKPAFEGAVIEDFADLVEQGLVYRALKPVHWSIANRTALAEAELEYEDRQDLSVYVDFEAADREAVEKAFGCELDCTPSFTIWTTTPWTLPANLAIAVHPGYRYAVAEVDGNLAIMASDLLAKVTKLAGSEQVRVVAETDGSKLVGLAYRHPFCDRQGRVVAADYVTLEDGTGLVHTAPGHGAEDYRTGLKEGLDTYCPVRDDGTYDDTVPAWLRGKSVWDANKEVVEHLRQSGHLYHDHVFTHSYPHDWRSKTPVIFRATEQWFIGVDRPTRREGRSLRALALDATGKGSAEGGVDFVPAWGRNRMRGMLESRPDWCISRQRAWGLPIPAFRTADGQVVLTPASVRAVAKRFREKGSDAWFTEGPAELLAHWNPAADPDAPKGVTAGDLAKLYDIFDVWFESGSSWNAVLRERGLGYPADLYLEGSDQHRGWFQLSLLPALGATGVPPFKALVTHGFIVDKDGKKMSKSLGNTIEVEELLKQAGAEVCRWWASSVPYEGDIKVDMSFFATAGEGYRKVRNTLRYLLSNLHDFVPAADEAAQVARIDPGSIDGWALGELAGVQAQVLAAYRASDFRAVHVALFDFCNATLSAEWFAATKDRLYCDRADSPRRRATQRAMNAVAEGLIRMLAPVLPHTADEAWRALKGAGARNVVFERHAPLAFTASAGWPAAFAARDAALKALESAKAQGIENPLDAGLVLPDPDGALRPFAADLADLMGVSRVELDPAAKSVAVRDLREEPRCERSRKRDGTVRQRPDGGMLSDRDAAAVG
ncbi:MAG: isoleucine--tRNA ligase [Planctomycetes bacterium]|nr:isoleucine--tRNA ligase [Planctomycetota bacterium]